LYNNLKRFIGSAKLKRKEVIYMSLKEWDNLGLTKNEQYTFTHYAEALRERGFDSATNETMKFLNDLNHFVKETEAVGITHTKINWKKMFTSSGEKEKKYWKTLKSELDKVSTDKLNALIERIQILIKYEKNVKNFSERLDTYAKDPLDNGRWTLVGGLPIAFSSIQPYERQSRDALGLAVLAVLIPMIASAQTLLAPLLPDSSGHVVPAGAPTQTELSKFKAGAAKINTQSANVLAALENRLENLEKEANNIYTSSQKVATEIAARGHSELLKIIKEAKRNPSKEVIISIMNLVKKQAPNGLGAVAGQVLTALNDGSNSPVSSAASVARNMNRSAPPKRSASPNKSDLSDSSYGSQGSSRRSAARSNSPGHNQRPAIRKNSPGSNGNSNKTKKKKSSFRPKTTPA
jgi:hypothetical protein